MPGRPKFTVTVLEQGVYRVEYHNDTGHVLNDESIAASMKAQLEAVPELRELAVSYQQLMQTLIPFVDSMAKKSPAWWHVRGEAKDVLKRFLRDLYEGLQSKQAIETKGA